jgi:hypothetical protein
VTMKKVIRATVIVLGYFRVVMGLEYFWYRFSLDSYSFWGTEIIILVLPSRSDSRQQLRSAPTTFFEGMFRLWPQWPVRLSSGVLRLGPHQAPASRRRSQFCRDL